MCKCCFTNLSSTIPSILLIGTVHCVCCNLVRRSKGYIYVYTKVIFEARGAITPEARLEAGCAFTPKELLRILD